MDGRSLQSTEFPRRRAFGFGPWRLSGFAWRGNGGAVVCGLAAGAVFFVVATLRWVEPLVDAVCGVGLRVSYGPGIEPGRRQARSDVEHQAIVNYTDRAKRDRFFRKPFSCVWEGYLVVPTSARYEFSAQSDDGLRLTVDGRIVLDNWRVQRWRESGCHGAADLEKGMRKLRIEFFSEGGGALRVKWRGGPIQDSEVLGKRYLRRR